MVQLKFALSTLSVLTEGILAVFLIGTIGPIAYDAKQMVREDLHHLTHSLPMFLFMTSETSEKLWFSDVFRGYEKGNLR